VPPVFGQKIAGKKIDFMAAMAAGLLLHLRADSIIEGTLVNKNEGLWRGAV
jgi:hypothetical protein